MPAARTFKTARQANSHFRRAQELNDAVRAQRRPQLFSESEKVFRSYWDSPGIERTGKLVMEVLPRLPASLSHVVELVQAFQIDL